MGLKNTKKINLAEELKKGSTNEISWEEFAGDYEEDKKIDRKYSFVINNKSEMKKVEVANKKLSKAETFVEGFYELLSLYNLNSYDIMQIGVGTAALILHKDAKYRFPSLITKAKDLFKNSNFYDEDTQWEEWAHFWLSKFTKVQLECIIKEFVQGFRKYGNKLSDSNPSELSKLAVGLLGSFEGGGYEVCDIGCGTGNFLLEVCQHMQQLGVYPKTIFGVDTNINATQITKFLLDNLYPKYYNEVRCVNALKAERYDLPLFQKGFCLPPLGMEVLGYSEKVKSKKFDYVFTHNNSSELLFMDVMISRLIGSNLKAIGVIPSDCLSRQPDKQYIDLLIKEGWVEGIIQLPAGVLNYASIPVCMIVFSPKNKGVKFIDCNQICKAFSGNFVNYKLPYDTIINKYRKTEPIEIKKLESVVNLQPAHFLLAKQVKFTGTPLSKMSEVITGCKYTYSEFEKYMVDYQTNCRILQSSNIEDDQIQWEKLTYIKNASINDKYLIRKNDIIITNKSSKIKIAIVDKEPDEQIIPLGGMIIIRPNCDKINPYYILMYLKSVNGQIALKLIQKGKIVCRISAEDVSKILIPDLEFEKQNVLAHKYEQMRKNYLFLKNEIDEIRDKIDRYFDNKGGE